MAKPRLRGRSYQLRTTINGETMTDTWQIPAGMTKKQAERQAQKEQDLFEERCRRGLNPNKITFAEVAQQYIDFITGTQKETSVKSHQDRIRLINPYIGHIEVKKLTKQHIRDYIAALEQPYTTKNGMIKTRSATTINDYYKTISTVLSFACESDYIEDNICLGKGIRKPKQTSDTDKSIPIDVVKAYADVLESAPLQDRLFFHLTLNTGMRKGEVLGLSWDNIDLNNNTVTICDNAQYIPEKGIIFQTTKRKASDRTITIPEYVSDMLRQMKYQQKENRLKAGKLWKANPSNPTEHYCENHAVCSKPCAGFCSKNCRLFKDSNRVFTNELGHPTHPDTLRKNLQKLGKKANLPKITVHGLRHTAASLAIKNGTAVADVSAYLGHSNPKVTLSVYCHAIREREEARSIGINIGEALKIAK